MAKRKMSSEQRVAIRKDITTGLSEHQEPAEILRTVSEKYGLSTETIRWYLKDIRRDAGNGKATSHRKGRPKAIAKDQIRRRPGWRRGPGRKKSPARRGIKKVLKGITSTLANSVRKAADKALKRAGALKGLLPRLKIEMKLEARLRKKERQVRYLLRAVRTRLKRLQREAARLTE